MNNETQPSFDEQCLIDNNSSMDKHIAIKNQNERWREDAKIAWGNNTVLSMTDSAIDLYTGGYLRAKQENEQALPLITGEPTELLRDICELETADESDVYAVRVRVKDLELVLARHFQLPQLADENEQAMKVDDHQVALLVNSVTHIARVYHDHQSLRQRISNEIVPMFQRFIHNGAT